MKKLKISTIILGTLLLLLFVSKVSLEASYKDEVDLMQSVIVTSKDIPNKEKVTQLYKTRQLGKEIIRELNIVKASIVVIIVLLFIVGFFYIKLSISRNKTNNQTAPKRSKD